MCHMTKAFSIDGKTSFNLAEEKASQYFEQLVERVKKTTYLPTLTKDIHIWKRIINLPYSLYFHEERKRQTLKIITIILRVWIIWVN